MGNARLVRDKWYQLNPDADSNAGLKQLTTKNNAYAGLTFCGIPAFTYNSRCFLVFLIT
jgi:hypothetical protein